MGGVGSEEGRAAVSLVWERLPLCMETETAGPFYLSLRDGATQNW